MGTGAGAESHSFTTLKQFLIVLKTLIIAAVAFCFSPTFIIIVNSTSMSFQDYSMLCFQTDYVLHKEIDSDQLLAT